jgi:hypothetical protein
MPVQWPAVSERTDPIISRRWRVWLAILYRLPSWFYLIQLGFLVGFLLTVTWTVQDSALIAVATGIVLVLISVVSLIWAVAVLHGIRHPSRQ